MRKGSLFIIFGLLLVAASLSLTGYNMIQSRRAGESAEAALEKLVPLIAQDPIPPEGRVLNIRTNTDEHKEQTAQEEQAIEIEYPDYILNPKMELPVQTVDNTEYIGILSLPSLGRDLPVISKWDYRSLDISPCRYTGSVYMDNMIICAHNFNRHFGAIKDLAYGDPVTFTDLDGNVFTYEVVEVETLRPTAVAEMVSGDWDLTLFTCTKGGATRVTVRCDKTE